MATTTQATVLVNATAAAVFEVMRNVTGLVASNDLEQMTSEDTDQQQTDDELIVQEQPFIRQQPDWLGSLEQVLRKYIITFLSIAGVLFNLLSISALFNKRVTFHKLLRYLFVLLNLSDSSFLVCTFMVFCAPSFSVEYRDNFILYAIPYLIPLLQTFLTISVYSVIAIAVQGMSYIYQSSRNAGAANSNASGGGSHRKRK